MAAVTVGHLQSAIRVIQAPETHEEIAARHVVFARSLDALGQAGRGDVVILDEPLGDVVGTYHFDLALGRAGEGLAAIVLPDGADASITGRRLAATRGVVLAHLRPGNDVATVSALLQRAQSDQRGDVAALLRAGCALIDSIEDPDDVDAALTELSELVGARVVLVRDGGGGGGGGGDAGVVGDLPIRVHGVERAVLRCDLDDDHPLLRSMWSHLARSIEEVVLRHDADAFVDESMRAALLNELLLGDAGTIADAASRLRRTGYPIDGSHAAVRIDCHDPVPDRRHAEFAVKQRLATFVSGELRHRDHGTWTRAGTDNSVIVVASHREALPELDREIRLAARELTDSATAAISGLRVFVGIGGTHGGVEGLSQAVMEATTAARSASTRASPNVPHHIDRLGLSRALVHWSEIDGVRPVLDEILAPLDAMGPVKCDRAIETLKAYLDTGRNVNSTARSLDVHRNTARYRIERISEALDVDLEDPDERLLVELACRVRESRVPGTS